MSEEDELVSEAERPAEEERPRKKKKKRKVAAEEGASPADTTAQPAADDRPPFAREWPRDEELDRLLAAFSRGNYATVRTGAPALAAKSADPAVKRAATELRRRIDPDPLSSVLLLIAIGLLAVFAIHYLGHDGAPETDKPADKRAPAAQPTHS